MIRLQKKFLGDKEMVKFTSARKKQVETLAEGLETKKLVAKDAMIKPVLVRDIADIPRVLKILKKEHINACVVVTKEKKYVGLISDNQIINLFLHQVKYEPLVQTLGRGYRREFLYNNAGELCKKQKSTVKTDDPINKTIELIHKEKFDYIPVLNKKDKVVGVITPSSIINLLKDH